MPRIRNLYPGLTLAGKVRVEGEEFDIPDNQDSSAPASADQIALDYAEGKRLVKGQRGAEMAGARSTFLMPEAPWKREGAGKSTDNGNGNGPEGPADESAVTEAADAPVPAQERQRETLPQDEPEPETPPGRSTRSKSHRK